MNNSEQLLSDHLDLQIQLKITDSIFDTLNVHMHVIKSVKNVENKIKISFN